MARSRELSKVLSSSTALSTDAEIAAVYQTQTGTGLKKIIPSSVAVGSGTGSADSLGTVTFSGASSVSLNGCFTSNYQNYQLIINISGTLNNDMYTRLRASGTDLSGSVYYSNGRNMSTPDSSTTYGSIQSGTTWLFLSEVSDSESILEINIFNPFESKYTFFAGSHMNRRSSRNLYWRTSGGNVNNTTSYDGVSFIPQSGNITGTIRVYGYN